MNDTGAFVATADDGAYHRLCLPGFDAPLYAETAEAEGVETREMLALSPDGTKIAYAWHEPFVDAGPDGRVEPGEGWVYSGARVVDLTTGDITTFPSAPKELDYLRSPSWAGDLELPLVAGQPLRGLRHGGEVIDGLAARGSMGRPICSTPRRRSRVSRHVVRPIRARLTRGEATPTHCRPRWTTRASRDPEVM